jgi:hypothetical protein
MTPVLVVEDHPFVRTCLVELINARRRYRRLPNQLLQPASAKAVYRSAFPLPLYERVIAVPAFR